MKNLITALCASLIAVACAPIKPTSDGRTPEQKLIDLRAATVELQGSYEIIEVRNDDYDFTKYKTQRADVKISGNILTISLIGQGNTLTIYASACDGSYNPSKGYYSLFCDKSMPGTSSVWLSKQYYDYEITDGALLGGFKPLQVRKGDYLLSYSETPKGRPHYYIFKKAK